jgi:Icc-related predicted phosphoesterase
MRKVIRKVVCVSDTHHRHGQGTLKGGVPECDLLIHAGDMTGRGQLDAVLQCYEWLEEQPARHIVTIPGNHELYMENQLAHYREEIKRRHPAIHLLVEESVEIEGVKIYGSPITPEFHNWAWNRKRGIEIGRHWQMIPDDVQILVTHGPPYGILDQTYYVDGVTPRERAGCWDLAAAIKTRLFDLKLHVFGHIHSGSGVLMQDGVTYVNAAICDEMYMPTNPPRIIEFGDDEFSKRDKKVHKIR